MNMDNENFYDEIASLMPQPGDYSLEELDEIIRSTDSRLDASLDMNVFTNSFDQNDYEMKITESNVLPIRNENPFQQIPKTEHNFDFDNDYHFKFSSFLSPTTSQQSAGYSSSYETPGRTSSPTSMDGDNFNPDDFINFLNEGDVKIDGLTTDTIMKLNENCRNTPSPTDSYTSSCGSSTSGVQSDASSEASLKQNFKNSTTQETDDELLEFIKFKNEKFEQGGKANESFLQQFDNAPIVIKEEDSIQAPVSPTATALPISVPVLPVSSMSNAHHVNYVQETIIPLQTVPLTPINPVINIKTPKPIKFEKKPSSKNNDLAESVKLMTSAINADDASRKITPPPNSKPKTIYLSSNDFKALMQKMNTNGKNIVGAQGQIPKIIMKTANGKLITANKITNSSRINSKGSTPSGSNNLLPTVESSSNSLSNKFVPKMAEAPAPVTVTHQPCKVHSSTVRTATLMAATRGTLNNTKSSRADFSILRSLGDEKLFKKQLRMLKNRESASLSRKKKKEYVERLENRISNLEKENYSLKGENSSLRSQLMAFAQTCNCKHGNVSDFILSTLNMNGKGSEAVLNAVDAPYIWDDGRLHSSSCNSKNTHNKTSRTHHVKIAPKPANTGPFINKSFKQRMSSANVKKNIAVLFAMAFMVTLNVGNFQNYLNKSTLENAIDASATGVKEEPVNQNGRRLLWVPNEHEFREHRNRTKREAQTVNMPPPPLHFLRPVNRTTEDKMNGTSTKDEPPIKRHSAATPAASTTYANVTQENMRLARNLHKWIGGNGYLNLTGTRIENGFEQMEQFKFGYGSYMDYDLPLGASIGTAQKRKIILDPQTRTKHARVNIEGDHNSLDVFKPRISEEYIRLFKGIKRQDDTFYVLSFNMDHILLPASAYSKSSRPKMSLMLPAGDPSNNGDIVLMQIDCEVINTTELEIKSHMIPEKLRPSKYPSNVRVNPDDIVNNKTAGPDSATVKKSKDLPLKREEVREKPSAPRTYFMMGPKSQNSLSDSITKAANIIKRKPSISKFNTNDSVIGSGILNVRNSSLFTRMRESVGFQTNGYVPGADSKK